MRLPITSFDKDKLHVFSKVSLLSMQMLTLVFRSVSLDEAGACYPPVHEPGSVLQVDLNVLMFMV